MAIKMIDIAPGIQWVEVPEVKLRLLCGCPADVVKHLIKRGLIVPQEINGITCESGPNAILLSDVALQNGEFANLAEFPVLQMLYKQGMMLPGHPNNDGRKPLLIGTANQVESQLRYIYRGNYGLVSCEEIMQAGISGDQADAMMRMKLKFAFGCITQTTDFLDTLVLANKTVEIAAGVHLQRICPNVFKLSYNDEAVTVNLNLGAGVTYECPYQLELRRFEPEFFAIIHSGEGDGWDATRPAMSSIITYQSKLYLIDAGPNLVNTLTALGISIDQVDGIFHTHAHDDHFVGLTALMRAGRRIQYFTTPLVRASVAKKLAALLDADEELLNDFFDVRDLAFDEWYDIEGLEVMPVFSPHPVETNLFVFRALWGEGYRTYAHFADIVSLDTYKNMTCDQQELPFSDQTAFERIRAAYLMPYDVKKIDIGGGLIHGVARDFREDTSKRILLAHCTGELTLAESKIGARAGFGEFDVLVAEESKGIRRHAYSYLEVNLPGISPHDLRTLINHPITEMQPGAIILNEGDVPQEVFLPLSGRVEKVRSSNNYFANLGAGSLIGDDAIHDNLPSKYTYRAVSFVTMLRLPLQLYTEVIRRNGLQERLRQINDIRLFLNSTYLFSSGLPAAVLGRIIEGATERHFRFGENIGGEDVNVINIIKSGLVERTVDGLFHDALKAHDFFGEEGAILNVPGLFHLRAIKETSTVQIDGALLKNVPLLRWKILENYQQKVARVVLGGDTDGFIWSESVAINVAEFDEHHRHLFEIANTIGQNLHTVSDAEALANLFDELREYTRYHFNAEENIMKLHNYPQIEAHTRMHGELVSQVDEYVHRAICGNVPDKTSITNFMTRWLVKHIFEEDRMYGAFFNEKGVF